MRSVRSHIGSTASRSTPGPHAQDCACVRDQVHGFAVRNVRPWRRHAPGNGTPPADRRRCRTPCPVADHGHVRHRRRRTCEDCRSRIAKSRSPFMSKMTICRSAGQPPRTKNFVQLFFALDEQHAATGLAAGSRQPSAFLRRMSRTDTARSQGCRDRRKQIPAASGEHAATSPGWEPAPSSPGRFRANPHRARTT